MQKLWKQAYSQELWIGRLHLNNFSSELERKGNRKTEELGRCIPSPELCFAWYGTSDLALPNWLMLHNVMLVKQIQRLQHSLRVFVVATIQPHQHPKGFLTSKPCAIWCSLILSAQFTWLGIMFCRFDLRLYILCEEQNTFSSCPWTKWPLSRFLLNMWISSGTKQTMMTPKSFPFWQIVFFWDELAVLYSHLCQVPKKHWDAVDFPRKLSLSCPFKRGSIKVLPV